jgi:inhibitor of KinA
MQITPLGDQALMVELGDSINESTHRRVQAAWRALAAEKLPGVSEAVPAYTSVTIYYDPGQVMRAGAPAAEIVSWLTARVRERLKDPPKAAKAKPRTVEVPVCYGGDFGPDLARVAAQAKLSPEDVIKRHSKATYLVYLIGFAPGFPYLGGLPKELATPRHAKPRMEVPAGSVGIAGEQAGIYPQVTPGGWNLIGATPLRLFRPEANPPVLLQAGDEVKFKPVSVEEFRALQNGGSR